MNIIRLNLELLNLFSRYTFLILNIKVLKYNNSFWAAGIEVKF